jgi:hydroxymethylbilane synthase
MNALRIGTRGSPLALWQANHVAGLLRAAHPQLAVELVEIQTTGDQVRDLPLAQIGGDGLFTKAIQQALLDEHVDLAVHSLKDLPTAPVAGLVLAATPTRGPVGDAFVSQRHAAFAQLPTGATVATSSQRRRAQLLHRRPDLKLVNIRGNVETRLRKLAESDLDALILAEAGLMRLNLVQRITEVLDRTWMLPAVGQGALGLECRTGDDATRKLVQALDDPATHAMVLAERAMLLHLGGGCQLPIGADTQLTGAQLLLRGVVLEPNGKARLEGQMAGTISQPEELGRRLAEDLLGRGARALLTGGH